ncbi:MAG: hypothetical protein K4571_02640 [Deltaproteobacteria bacterium]
MRIIRGLLFKAAVIAVAAVMLAGCSLINPHIQLKPPSCAIASQCTLEEGIQYAESAKVAYMNAIGCQSAFVSLLGIGIIPVTATALGLGITGQGATAITVLGLTAASGYAAGTWLYSKPNQRAWLVGYNATTCAVDAVVPLLYVEKKKDEIKEKKEKLDDALAVVPEKIRNVRDKLAEVEGKTGPELDELRKSGDQRVREAEKLLNDAGETNRAAEKMLLEAATAGESLKQTVDKIRGKVSQQIIESAPDMQALVSLIGGMAASYGRFVTVPEGFEPPSKSGVEDTKKSRTTADSPETSLGTAIEDLEKSMHDLQSAAGPVANIVNAVAASKPVETLKACGVNVEQTAQPMTIEPAGRIGLTFGKPSTVGRVIRGGQAPYAVVLQGDADGPMVRQTEPFGPAFTVQITDKTPAKEYSIYISDKAGRKLFLEVNVNGGPPAK